MEALHACAWMPLASIIASMATVFKKSGSQYWYAQFYNHKGDRVNRSTGLTKKRDAQKAAESMEAEDRKTSTNSDFSKQFSNILQVAARDADAGGLTLARADELLSRMKKLANPDFRELSLREAWDQWRNLQAVSASTAKGYAEDQKMFAAALGERVMVGPLGNVTTAMIAAALRKAATTQGGKGRAARPRKAATVNKSLASLRRALEWAVNSRLIPANPAKEVRPLPENDSTEKGPFSADEVRRLISAAAEPTGGTEEESAEAREWAGIILNGAHTSLRMGDLVRLSDQFIDGPRYIIRPEKTKRTRKVVVVPLSPQLLEWATGRKGLFFPRIAKLTSEERSMAFERIRERADVPKKISVGGIEKVRTFHSLRHTFSSWLADAGVHADVRQKLTGHSSSSVHQKYTHHDESLNAAVAHLPKL